MEATDRKKWKTGRPSRPVAERFWEKVDKNGPAVTDALGRCWLWTASLDLAGYGQFGVTTGKIVKAYRWAYEQTIGPVPAGLQLDHLCRVRDCVRPDHLEPVTPRENYLRGVSPAARAAKVTHCPLGHPYDDQNTRITRKGHRSCRACERERQVGVSARRTPEQVARQNARARARYAAKQASRKRQD